MDSMAASRNSTFRSCDELVLTDRASRKLFVPHVGGLVGLGWQGFVGPVDFREVFDMDPWLGSFTVGFDRAGRSRI